MDFYAPEDGRIVSEVVLTGPASPPIAALEDLAGQRVHVRPSSSYHASLVALNARFAAEAEAAHRRSSPTRSRTRT